MARASLCSLVWLLALLFVSPASAQDPDESRSLILAPADHPPTLRGEVHLDLAVPLAARRLCPGERACVIGTGGGIGGRLAWRWPSGFAAGIAYDAWFLDGNGVYELTVMQVIQAVGRLTFLQEWAAHPFVGLGIGFVVLGDTFRAATAGASLDLKTGLEVEITPTLAFTFTALVRLFSVGSFTSESDGLPRASPFGVNAVLGLSLGLMLTRER